MDLFISATLILVIIAGLWRYSWYLGKKSGYDLGYEQARKDYTGESYSIKANLPSTETINGRPLVSGNRISNFSVHEGEFTDEEVMKL